MSGARSVHGPDPVCGSNATVQEWSTWASLPPNAAALGLGQAICAWLDQASIPLNRTDPAGADPAT